MSHGERQRWGGTVVVEFEDFKSVSGQGGGSQSGEFARAVSRVVGHGHTSLVVPGLLEMARQSVGTFGDGPGIDRGGSQWPHYPASAAGSKRDVFPKQFDEAVEFS